MAIIYTYPKLQNPQGNELIVVTDVNNKNATRLITIASIASLIPGGGGGCSSAIAGILTGAGDYIPPLCNEVTFTGSGIDISADQATATVTFTVPPVSIPCADAEIAGTVKVTDPQIPSGELTLSESGNYYAVQINEECKLGVRIPDGQSYELPCATPTALGGIKAQNNVGVISVPEVAGSGTYYPIELMKDPGVVTGTDCTAIVKVPTTTVSCASAITLGSIKAPKVILAAPPEIPEEGTYYSIETITEPTEPNDECRAVVKIPTPEEATFVAAQSSGTNADPNLRLTSGANVDDVQLVGGTDITITRNSDTQITIDSSAVSGSEYLIKAVTHSTTITTTTNPSRFTLPQLTAATTPFAQIKFTPSSVTGTNNDVFTVFKRPQNTENYVKIVVKCAVLTADSTSPTDERYFMGLHHSVTDVSGANLTYNWQVTGDYDRDDVASGDQLNQIQFTWYIQVGDLLNAAGEIANSGEDCYIYVKSLYDSSSTTVAPHIILGRQWTVDPTTSQGTIEAAGPLEICAYEIPSTKYENNPAQPG